MRTRFTLKPVLFFVLMAVAALPGQGQVVIAEQKGYNPGSYLSLVNYTDPDMGDVMYQAAGQTFLSGSSSPLGTIQFYIASANYPGNVNIEIYACSSATAWGSLLNTQTGVTISATGWVIVDVSALHIQLTGGNYYGLRFIPQDGLMAGIGINNDLYADGQSWTTNGSSSSFHSNWDFPFSIAAGSSLPITLRSFTAQKQGNEALLQWSTATEQNSSNFAVQHSTDGSSWSTIAILPAAGNSNTLRNYSYVHSNPATGNNYYRLLQTDMDGKSNYSNVLALSFAGSAGAFTVLANPVSNGVVQLQVNNTVALSLYGPDGRLLWKKQLGAGRQSIDISRYGKGIFLLEGPGATEKILVP